MLNIVSKIQYMSLANSYHFEAQLAEALWTVFAVSALLVLKPWDRLPRSLREDIALKGKIGPAVKRGGLALVAIGLTFLALAVLKNIVAVTTGDWAFNLILFPQSPIWNSQSLGVTALVSFLTACIGWVCFRLERGLLRASKETLLWFVSPILLAYELVLWWFDPREMDLHVINSLNGLNAFGFYLVSNYYLLFLSALLVGYAAWGRIPLDTRTRFAVLMLVALTAIAPIGYSAMATSSGVVTVVSDTRFMADRFSAISTTIRLQNSSFVTAWFYNLTLIQNGKTFCLLTVGVEPLRQGEVLPVVHFVSSGFTVGSQLIIGRNLSSISLSTFASSIGIEHEACPGL